MIRWRGIHRELMKYVIASLMNLINQVELHKSEKNIAELIKFVNELH